MKEQEQAMKVMLEAMGLTKAELSDALWENWDFVINEHIDDLRDLHFRKMGKLSKQELVVLYIKWGEKVSSR